MARPAPMLAQAAVRLDPHAEPLFTEGDGTSDTFVHYAARRAQIIQDKLDKGCYSNDEGTLRGPEYLRLRRRLIMSTIKRRALDVEREERAVKQARLDLARQDTSLMSRTESNTSLTDLSEATTTATTTTTGMGGREYTDSSLPSTPTSTTFHHPAPVTPPPISVTQRQRQRALTMQNTVAHAYAFGGLHHLFVEHSQAITAVKFANYDADLLAFASRDGGLSVARVKKDPQIIHTLKGHQKAILDFEFSQQNEFILSTSEDKTLRLWDTEKGTCLRTIKHTQPSTCVSFHPMNGNSFLTVSSGIVSHAGPSMTDMIHGKGPRGFLNFFNLSTGKLLYNVKTESPLTCLVIPPNGAPLYAGDEKGNINLFIIDKKGRYKRPRGHGQVVLSPNNAITWLSYHTWAVAEKNDPYLLANCADGQLRMLRCISSVSGKPSLAVTHKFAVVQRSESIRSCFCPLISHRGGACIVSGSEDANIYIFDVLAERDGSCINKLQGHSSAVLDVAWNYDETLLASGDKDGQVFLWKRQQTTNTTEGIVDDVDDVYL